MDPNTAMEAAAEGAKALTKLQEIVQKVFGPRWTRRQADADAYADERKLQTIRNNPDMEIVYVAGEMHAREKTPEVLARRAEQRMIIDSIRQETNIENILEITSKELQQTAQTSDEPVDDDWVTRFFDIVKDINSEEMQYVWAKILAGEINKPGSFSMRTLETIRNLSKKEAALFQKILPLVMCSGNGYFISSKVGIINKYDISYEDVLLLDECGLLVSNDLLTLDITLQKNGEEVLFNKNRAIKIANISEETYKISVSVYSLTKSGRELINTLQYDSNIDYINDFVEELFDNNKNKIHIAVHEIIGMDGDVISIKKEPLSKFHAQE